MNTIEAVAEAIHSARGCSTWGVSCASLDGASARAAVAALAGQGWHTHDEGVTHLAPVDESADGDIGPTITETGSEYAAKSVSVSWSDDFMAAITEGDVAQVDITDEQIMDAVPIYTTDAQYLAAVRALLARQAAVHATREAELETGQAIWKLNCGIHAENARALRATVERLRVMYPLAVRAAEFDTEGEGR